MKSLAIIPARGGSKRIPRKNIKPFAGRPIIEYSIRAALDSGCFTEVMVSTDDPEIAELAKSYGAKVPFYRSKERANDFATTAQVLIEVLEEYKKRDFTPETVCCIYPTAPFVTGERLRQAMELLQGSGADSVMPVVRFSYPIQRSLRAVDGHDLGSPGPIAMFWPEHIDARSQDLTPAFHDAGQFYCINTKAFLMQKALFMNTTIGIAVPEKLVQDIDTEEDWLAAEMKYAMAVKGGDAREKA